MKKICTALLAILVTAAFCVLVCVAIKTYHHSLLPRKEHTIEGTKIHIERLDYWVNGKKICGTVYKPQDTTGRKSAVIYCHGLGSTMKGSSQLLRMVASRGYVAYSFDFRGGSPESCSEGDCLEMSVKTELDDLKGVIACFRKEDFVDSRRLYLMGHSQGALVAALAAPKVKGLKGLVLLSPAFNLRDLAEEMYPRNRRIPDSTRMLDIMTVGKKYFTDAKKTDPYGKLSGFKGDVLIIHGSSDRTVPVEYAARACAEFPNARLEVLDGAGHSLTGRDGDRMAGLVRAYLDEHN